MTGVNGLSQLPYGGRRLKEQRKFAFSCLREIGRVGKIELEEKIVQEIEVRRLWNILGTMDRYCWSVTVCEICMQLPVIAYISVWSISKDSRG